MAYDEQELEKLSLKVIKKHGLIKIQEIVAYLPCSRATFYNIGLDRLDTIKKAIYEERIKRKVKLRAKWEEDKAAPVLQLAAYKLMADEDELNRLSNKEVKQSENKTIIVPTKWIDEE